RRVDLDGAEARRVIGQHRGRLHVVRIERAFPLGVIPARGSDADACHAQPAASVMRVLPPGSAPPAAARDRDRSPTAAVPAPTAARLHPRRAAPWSPPPPRPPSR